jgi:hypothetical protein
MIGLAFAGEPVQSAAQPSELEAVLLWVDALTARGWVGVVALGLLLGFTSFVLWLRQRGQLQRETSAVTSAIRAARDEWRDKRRPTEDA